MGRAEWRHSKDKGPLLHGKLPRGWECWTGVGGILYAGWRKSSPPVVLRAATADELAAKIRDYHGDTA